MRTRNFASNNAGPIFWWDVPTLLTLLIAPSFSLVRRVLTCDGVSQ
jgi:hypothetical protein